MSSENESFWQKLPCIDTFNRVFDEKIYHVFPADWYVFVADIEGSTQAIDEGRYKDVNLISALSIIGVLNACKKIEIPYVFGGDGATLLIPPSYFSPCLDALLATKARAMQGFKIKLRVGAIKVGQLYEQKLSLHVAKLQVSPDYEQAIFFGGGLSQAENLIKQNKSLCFDLPDLVPEADFTGLECRWKDIPSSRDETISLLIMANDINQYDMILGEIDKLLGSVSARHPVSSRNLALSFSAQQLSYEAQAKFRGNKRLLHISISWLENLIGLVLMFLGKYFKNWQWGNFKQHIQVTTDAEKFDDMLRMVCCVNIEQREALEQYLQSAQQQGQLNYGIHISDRALMTCLVFERHGKQVHFVDAADGGYALAAKMLKSQNK